MCFNAFCLSSNFHVFFEIIIIVVSPLVSVFLSLSLPTLFFSFLLEISLVLCRYSFRK